MRELASLPFVGGEIGCEIGRGRTGRTARKMAGEIQANRSCSHALERICINHGGQPARVIAAF